MNTTPLRARRAALATAIAAVAALSLAACGDDGNSGATATFTAPSTPGSYSYLCTIHPTMKGTLTVT